VTEIKSDNYEIDKLKDIFDHLSTRVMNYSFAARDIFTEKIYNENIMLPNLYSELENAAKNLNLYVQKYHESLKNVNENVNDLSLSDYISD